MGVFRHDKTGKDFDDGINAIPGDPEFTRDLAEAHFGDKAFSYISTPTYEPPLVAVFEKQLADAKAEQDAADAAEAKRVADELAAAEAELATEEVKP